MYVACLELLVYLSHVRTLAYDITLERSPRLNLRTPKAFLTVPRNLHPQPCDELAKIHG
jgi:hypothetical protein